MGILLKKGPGFVFSGIAKLGLVAFIVSFASALTNTVWAVYIQDFVKSPVYVGLISAFLTIIAFSSYFIFIPLVEKHEKNKIYIYSLALAIPLYALVAFAKNFYIFLFLAFFITILFTLRITSFGIIVKDRSKKGQLSGNEGFLYSFMNLSWVIAPLIAGYIASVSGSNFVFLFSALFLVIGLVVFKAVNIRDHHVKKKVDSNMKKNFFEFFKNRDRFLAYTLGAGVVIWFTLIYLFMPLYIVNSGLDKLWVGYFLFAISLPLIFTEYRFSKLAGKYGFKKMFFAGFIFVGVISIICFFISNIYAIMGLLVLASFGMAMVEPTTEAYFFDILKKGESSRFYGPYNTRADIGGLIARVLATVSLVFLQFEYLFILFGIFMFSMLFFIWRMRDVVEEDS